MAKRALFTTIAAAALAFAGYASAARAATPDSADTVKIYAAGSLKGIVGLLMKDPALAGVTIDPTFASSGLLKDRIKAGERPDLFLSADMASPRALSGAGLGKVPPTAFARNHMCLFAKGTAGITADNLEQRLLAPDLRIRTSTPVADPSGDYAVEIFDRLDQAHPGAGKAAATRAKSLRDSFKGQPDTPPAQLFATGKIDAMIAYCSTKAAMLGPGIVPIHFPPQLDPLPIFGMVVLDDKPSALKLALFLLSERGQALLKQAGFTTLIEAK